jgi:hypothetical protein
MFKQKRFIWEAPLPFGPVAKQYILEGAYAEETCLPHRSHKQIWRKTRICGPDFPLMDMLLPSTLTSLD